MLKRYKNNIPIFLLIAFFASVIFSCQEERLFDTLNDTDDNIMVSATITPSISTRNEYIEEGPINKENSYYIYYPRKSSSSYVNHAMVDFGALEGPTTGFAYFFDANGVRKDLKWKHVYNEGASSQTFRMHNIDSTLFTIYADGHWEHLRFNVKDVVNPYVTSPLDEINGTNDLLYGTASGSRSTGKLNFNMKHVMSLLKINIEVYSANDNFKMDLSNAEVTITDVSTELGVFDMRDPVLFEYNTSTSTTANSGGYNHYPGYYRNIQDVVIVDADKDNPDDIMNWASIHEGEVGEDYKDYFSKEVYESHRWIMPPQSMPTTTGRAMPQLIVKIPWEDATGGPGPEEYKIYKGMIPTVMFQIDENGNYNSSPEFISFKSGHQINITAQINSPETELTFAPVTIEAWMSKGSFTITTQQAGIYNSTDFYNVTRLFKEGFYDELERFGSVDETLCSLQIWGNISLDMDRITESMKTLGGDPNYSQLFEFCFNGYSVTLTRNGEIVEVLEGAVGQERLYNIVTGRNVSNYKGITTPEDFLQLIEYCNAESPDKEDLKKHGYFNNMDNKFTFDIRNDITLELADVLQKISYKVLGYEIVFDEANGSVVTINLPGGATLTARSTDIIDKLKQVVLANPTNGKGFYDNDSFLFMIECYNNYAYTCPDLLGIYGTKNSDTGKWTFNDRYNYYPKKAGDYSSYIYLDGDYVFGGMIPGGPNNNPDYAFWATSNAFLSISNEYITYSSGNADYSNWKHVTANDSKTKSFATTISYYNSKSTQYLYNQCGYFQEAMWHFPLDPSYTEEAFDVIFGSMIVDYENKKWPYEITWEGEFTVTGVPDEEGSEETKDIVLTFPDDKEVMMSIANGTFWEKYR